MKMQTPKPLSGKQFHFDNLFFDAPLRCGFIDLYQTGELCCEAGFTVPEHDQLICEITYVISGKGTVYSDGEPAELNPGTVVVNSAGHTHKIETEKNSILRFAYIGFQFNEGANKEKYEALRKFYTEKPYAVCKAKNNILYPFLKLVDEFYSRGAYSEKLIETYCEQIILLTARCFLEEKETAPNRSPHRESGAAAYAAVRYIEKNLENITSVSSVAESLGYSETYLSHTFKNHTGTTLQKYIRYKKIEYAAELLREGELSPVQVCSLLKFESLSSFSRAFKAVIGVSPRAYTSNEKDK